VLHCCGGEDQQYSGRLCTLVRELVDDAPWYHDELACRGRKSTLSHPYSQLPIKDVEGLLVIAVEVRQGLGDRVGIMLSWTE
jgi:hypothetical protein